MVKYRLTFRQWTPLHTRPRLQPRHGVLMWNTWASLSCLTMVPSEVFVSRNYPTPPPHGHFPPHIVCAAADAAGLFIQDTTMVWWLTLDYNVSFSCNDIHHFMVMIAEVNIQSHDFYSILWCFIVSWHVCHSQTCWMSLSRSWKRWGNHH